MVRSSPNALRLRTGALVLVATSAVVGLATVAPPMSAGADPPGNNGTIKVDDVPFDDHPDNEPHVGCTFEIDFYGFDEGDLDAEVIFEAHPPAGRVELIRDTVDVGEDSNSGGGSEDGLDASKAYTLDLSDLEAHPNQGYHVKLTIHAEGSIGADVKHKVFWVTGCETPPPPPPPPTTTTTIYPSTTTSTTQPSTTTSTTQPSTTTSTIYPSTTTTTTQPSTTTTTQPSPPPPPPTTTTIYPSTTTIYPSTTTTTTQPSTTTTIYPSTTTTTQPPPPPPPPTTSSTTTTTTMPSRGEGCTPGFWKNHLEAWEVYTPTQTLESVFSVPDALDLDDASLQAALAFDGGDGIGGGARILFRAAAAALLNAASSDVDYPLLTTQVISQVNTALASGERSAMIELAAELDALNNLGCPN